jgi:hypothetical protein
LPAKKINKDSVSKNIRAGLPKKLLGKRIAEDLWFGN